jgi:hypothetical protein
MMYRVIKEKLQKEEGNKRNYSKTYINVVILVD